MRGLIGCLLLLASSGAMAQPVSEPPPTPAAAPAPPAAAGPSADEKAEDEAAQRLLMQGIAQLSARRSQQAIDCCFDKIIAIYEQRQAGRPERVHTSRSLPETLTYLAAAAAAKEPQRSAIVMRVPHWSDALYLKGYALFELNRLDEAEAALRAALALAEHNAIYRIELGQLHIKRRQWPEAMALFVRAEQAVNEFTPATMKNVELARAWRGQAYVHIELMQLDEAERLYKRCLELNAQDRSAINQLAYIAHLRSQTRPPPPAARASSP